MLDADDGLDCAEDAGVPRAADFMLQDPATIEPALDLILVSRHLERIGDHATNIAEDVIFMVLAKDVRHHVNINRGASPLGLPNTLSREPLRRLAPFAWLASLRSFAFLGSLGSP